jgi:hypothetical protein
MKKEKREEGDISKKYIEKKKKKKRKVDLI